jgi:integrase/recombinase XerC
VALEAAVRNLESMDVPTVNGYRAHLLERGLKVATVNRRLAALKSLVKLARLVGLCSFSLEVESLPSEPYRDTRGPGKDGFLQMLELLEGCQEEKARRDRAMLRLMYDLALRRGEVVSLDVEHVQLKEKVLWVSGKGRRGERQKLTLAPKTRDALAAWLMVRGEEPGPLFVNLDNPTHKTRLSGTGLYLVVRELGQKVGLKVRPHGLRHAAITEALELTGGNVRVVQKFSRHKDLRVLCVYDDARQDLAGEVSLLLSQGT